MRRSMQLLVLLLFVAPSVVSSWVVGEERPSTAPAPVRDSRAGAQRTSGGSDAKGGEPKANRLREGSKLVDQVGEFQRSGEQINFFAKDGIGSVRVLENLALERIARALDDPTMRAWSVSGFITEYRGENYLLVTRAVLKAQPKPGPSGGPRGIETTEEKVE